MKSINGKYKFRVEVAGDGFIHTLYVWAKDIEEAQEIAKRSVPNCEEIRGINQTEISSHDVRNAVLVKIHDLHILKHTGNISSDEALEILLRYVQDMNQ